MVCSMKPFPDTKNEHALSPPPELSAIPLLAPLFPLLDPNAPHLAALIQRMHRDLRISQRHLTHSHLITPRCNPGAKYLSPPPPFPSISVLFPSDGGERDLNLIPTGASSNLFLLPSNQPLFGVFRC